MKESYYFQHDYNAINDPKMMLLLSSCWLTWVGMYRIIIEILHQQEDSMISVEAYKEYIKFYCQDKEIATHVEQVLNTCWLLLQQNGNICSNRVLKNKKLREEISIKRSLAGKISAEKRAKDSQTSTSVEQGKEKKGKERKEKEKKKENSDFPEIDDLMPIPIEGKIIEEVNQQEKIELRKKISAVNSKGKFLLWVWNDITWRNDLMENDTFRWFEKFITETTFEDFKKRVELFNECKLYINKYKLWKFLDAFGQNNIHEYSITDFIKKINRFGGSKEDVFRKITGKDYVSKVLRIINPKVEEVKPMFEKDHKWPEPWDEEKYIKAKADFINKFKK